MKNFYFFLVISFLMLQNIFAQEEAFSKSSLSLGNLLYDVNFISSQSGWAVGAGGTIMHTNDGGISWTMQLSGTTNRLWGVSFTDENNGIVVGWEGTILKTIDGGLNWTLQQSGTTEDLLGVFFTNANNGIAIGFKGKILRTTNGGINWQSQSNGVHWYSIYFTNSNNGILVGSDARILKTTDGGITWASQILGSFEWFFDVSFADANNGIVVGSNGTIMKTTDGGTSWRTSQSGVEYDLSGVFYIDANNAVSVGENGIILQTTDGGVTWNSQKSPAIVKLFDVAFTDLNNGIIVGDYGLILKTTNGGKIWTAQMNTKEAPVLFSPANDAFDVGLDTVLLWSDLILKADNYHLQLSTDSSFNTLIYNDSTIINNNLEVNKLADSTLYYWRVRGKINDEYGDWSSTWQFRTLAKTARLFSPLNNSTISPANITLQWSPTSQTSNYRLQVSTDSLFATNVIDQDNIVGLSAVINVSYGTKYFWRVGAKNEDGNTYWSDNLRFQTRPLPTTSFPLELGNKWYYKAGSTRDYYYYGVEKEITDTLSNGFKKVIVKYFYQDSISVSTELWAYKDGKFYINDFSTVYYNDYITHDTCSSTGMVEICWHLIPYQIFELTDTAQVYSNWFRMHGAVADEVTIFPEIGIVKDWHYSYFTSAARDSIYLVGLYRNGEVLGDTTLLPPPVYQGDDWVMQNSGSANDLNAVSFTDRYTGTVVGQKGTILRTTNGGTTWYSQSSGTTENLNDISFIGANNGIAVGNSGVILKTTDGGSNWVPQVSGGPSSLYNLYRIDESIAIAIGDGVIIKTTTGGATWGIVFNIGSGGDPQKNGISFSDRNNGLIVAGSGAVIHTNDGGTTWRFGQYDFSFDFYDVFFVNGNNYSIVGYNTRTNTGLIMNSTGIPKSSTDQVLLSVNFTDSTQGIAVGNNGTIVRTSNGGANWFKQSSGTIKSLNDVTFADAKNGWIVGAGGVILHTTSATKIISDLIFPENNSVQLTLPVEFKWSSVPNILNYELQISTNSMFTDSLLEFNNLTDTSITLNSLNYAEEYFWRVGTISSDGKLYWSSYFNFTTINPQNITNLFLPINGAPSVSQPITFKWSKVPGAWTYEFQIAADSLCYNIVVDQTVQFDTVLAIDSLVTNKKYYWRVRRTGSDLYWSQIYSFTTKAAPIEFSLEQNYPNPFNGSTKFKYTLTNKTRITIQLYNVLGEKVKTLVDSEKEPGAYFSIVDAAGLPSGIYFYQLRAGEFVQTKKMVLLR